MTNLGIVARHKADYDVARYFFQESIELYRARGDQLSLGNALRYLGQVYYDIGQLMAARQCYEESLKLHRMIGDKVGEALTQQKLGQLYRSLGNFGEAETLLEEALLTHIATDDRIFHLGAPSLEIGVGDGEIIRTDIDIERQPFLHIQFGQHNVLRLLIDT